MTALARGFIILAAIIVWERGDGTLKVGSGPLPEDVCRHEQEALLRMSEADRSNYGQSPEATATWIIQGHCVVVVPR